MPSRATASAIAVSYPIESFAPLAPCGGDTVHFRFSALKQGRAVIQSDRAHIESLGKSLARCGPRAVETSGANAYDS